MTRGASILVVEDDADCRTVLAELLELSGYRVAAFREAPAALDVARRSPPGLVMVDLHLPGRDGAWLVRELRSAGGQLASVPVLLTTGSPDARSIAESLGVVALEKPFDVERLLERVDAMISRPGEAR